jgi:hypothetical protein
MASAALTVTDTAGGRKLELVGWLNDRGWYISTHPDYDAVQLAMIERMGYTRPVYAEAGS